MTDFQTRQAQLQAQPKTWLITGVVGFTGSNLLQGLLTRCSRSNASSITGSHLMVHSHCAGYPCMTDEDGQIFKVLKAAHPTTNRQLSLL